MIGGTSIVVAGLVVGQLWASRSLARRRWEWLFKPLASLGFVALGLSQGVPDDAYGRIMAVGLVLAALGDAFLIPKSRRWFLAGLVSFLLGHVAYAAAFAVRGLDASALGLATGALVVVGAPIVRWLWPHVDEPMRGPVAAYVLVISAMVALAVGTVAAHGNPWILVGAVGFYLSDLAVAQQRFIRSTFASRAWGLPLYYAAQLVLATTIIAG